MVDLILNVLRPQLKKKRERERGARMLVKRQKIQGENTGKVIVFPPFLV